MSNTSGQAYALMVMTPIRDGEEQALRDYLAQLPTGPGSPLARLGTTHLGRWLVLHDLVYQGPPQDRDSLQSPYLIFTSNFDGALAPYLADLHEHLREEADEIWGRCIGYPGSDDADAFAAYLQHNQIDTTFFFSAYGDATVPEVLRALDLRDRVTALAIATQTAPAAELRSAYLASIGGAL
jgi:hypothetical protein